MPNKPAKLALIRRIAFFQHLNDDQLKQISTLLKEQRYRAGQIIFFQGDIGDGLYLISSGRVRIYLTSPDGTREATVRIYGPGCAFGEFAVLDGAPRSANAVALEDVSTFILSRGDFIKVLQENFALVLHMFALLTERLRYTTMYSEQLAFLSVSGRVAITLLRLANVEAEMHEPIRLDLSQQELAEFANTTRESVNRVLHTFAAKNLIQLESRTLVVLDRAGLTHYVR